MNCYKVQVAIERKNCGEDDILFTDYETFNVIAEDEFGADDKAKGQVEKVLEGEESGDYFRYEVTRIVAVNIQCVAEKVS